MLINADDFIRNHHADLMDQACRARRAGRLARTEQLRHRAEDAVARHRAAAARSDTDA